MKKITKTALILATGLSALLVASNSYAHHTVFSSPLMSCQGATQYYCNAKDPIALNGTLKSGSINVDSDGSLQIKINGAAPSKTYQLNAISYVPTNTPGDNLMPIWSTPPVGSMYQFQYANTSSGDTFSLGSFTTDANGRYNGPVRFGATLSAQTTIFKFAPGTVIPSMAFNLNNADNGYSEFITGVSTKLATDKDDD